MSEIGSGSGSSYPGGLDTDSTQESTSTTVRADVPNDLAAAIVAIEAELGTDPAGTLSTVKAFLQTEHDTDGTHNFSDFSSAKHTHLNNATAGTLQFLPVRDTSRGLIIKNGSTADEQVDVDADEIILQDSSGISKSVTSVNLTINNTASGNLGLDTGSVTTSTWYYIWVLNGSSGTGGVISTASSFGSVTKPSGYNTYGALVGAILTDGTSDFFVTYQIGNRARCLTGNITVSAGTATSTDISSYVPATARKVYFTWYQGTGIGSLHIHPLTFTVSNGNSWFQVVSTESTAGGHGDCPIETAQTIFVGRDSNSFTVYIQGWEY